MSRETMNWLNENVLVGFTEKRGNAWHYRAGSDNHYVGAIPVDDVRKRLFDFTAEEHHVHVGRKVGEQQPVGPFGNLVGDEAPGLKAITHSRTGHVFGVFTDSYHPHDYDEWLVTKVEGFLDDDLQIGTAGLLRNGGQAWVQVEVPETMEFAGGVKARPFLLAATSLDGSLATTYGASATVAVCDNTMAIAMGEHGGFRAKIRHSINSLTTAKAADVRDALGVVFTAASEFGAQVEALLDIEYTDQKFWELVQDEVPLPADPKKAPGAFNLAMRKREHLMDMYRFDVRVAPWTGTAFGAWSAFNTFEQHEARIRKTTNRVERNASAMVTGRQDKADGRILAKITELVA